MEKKPRYCQLFLLMRSQPFPFAIHSLMWTTLLTCVLSRMPRASGFALHAVAHILISFMDIRIWIVASPRISHIIISYRTRTHVMSLYMVKSSCMSTIPSIVEPLLVTIGAPASKPKIGSRPRFPLEGSTGRQLRGAKSANHIVADGGY